MITIHRLVPAACAAWLAIQSLPALAEPAPITAPCERQEALPEKFDCTRERVRQAAIAARASRDASVAVDDVLDSLARLRDAATSDNSHARYGRAVAAESALMDRAMSRIPAGRFKREAGAARTAFADAAELWRLALTADSDPKAAAAAAALRDKYASLNAVPATLRAEATTTSPAAQGLLGPTWAAALQASERAREATIGQALFLY